MKKISSMFMVIIITILLCQTTVFAVDSLEFHMEQSAVSENGLQIYVNASIDRDEYTLGTENFKISLGDDELPCVEALYLADTEEPVTYIYLVDISGSIQGEKLALMKDCLKSVTDTLGEQDKVSLVTIGNTLNAGEFVSGKENIYAQIDAITGSAEDTNLYYGIVESLKRLNSSDQVTNKKALIIVSDGQDDQKTGITRDEVNGYIEKTRIPVYTMAMLNADASAEKQEYAKILGSFARLSPGGIHATFGVGNATAAEAAAQIAESVGESMILTADLSDYKEGNGQAFLQVTLHVDDLGTANDGYNYSEQEIGEVQKAAEPDPTAAPTATPTPTPSPTPIPQGIDAVKEWVSVNTTMTIIIGAGIVLLIVIIIVLIISSSKKKKKYKEEMEARERKKREEEERKLKEELKKNNASNIKKGNADGMTERAFDDVDVSNIAIKPNDEPGKKPETAAVQPPDIIIYLTEINHINPQTHSISIWNRVTIGRDAAKAQYVITNEEHMSRVHCSITYSHGNLILVDEKSKNGTSVNGVYITQPFALKKDDIIQMGKTKYRVHW